MRKVILTFDYEIYFDGNNDYTTLLSNTNKILEIAIKSKSKLVFFVDVYYLIKLKEFHQETAYILLLEQINQIRLSGNEIQFHFHPHWINSKYEEKDNKWVFDKSEYSFSDIVNKYGIEMARNKFNEALFFFRSELNADISAFRAGGLSIDGNQSDLIDLLKSNNFKFDSSVFPGFKLEGKFIHSDHQKVPLMPSWSIENSFFKSSTNGALTEIPIMSMFRRKIKIAERLLTSVIYKLKLKFNRIKVHAISGKSMDLEVYSSSFPIGITFDKSSMNDLIILKFYTRSYLRNNFNLMCVLSHPKSFNSDSFNVFETYLEWSKKRYSIVGFNDLLMN